MGFHGPEIFILLIKIFISLLTVFWLVAFIHCIVNKWLRRGEKVAWILVLLFVNWIGALSYFIYWYGFAKQKRCKIVLPVPSEQNYSPYEQGYQPARTQDASQVQPFIAEREEPEEIMSPLYEQPQVMYPEDPR